jgi:hypothetical protein
LQILVSKVQIWRLFNGWPSRPERPPIELSGAIMSLLSDEPFFRLGFSRYDCHRRTRQSNEFWWMVSECESSWDDGYRMIWVKPIERTSPQSKFASGRAPSWWREWVRKHNNWWRELVLS